MALRTKSTFLRSPATGATGVLVGAALAVGVGATGAGLGLAAGAAAGALA